MSDAPRIGSLFTGYGGLDSAALAILGLESSVAWHVEIKPAACTLLDYRDPGVPNLGDITKIDPASVAPVDALTFGWPCQPHSSAGKRLGEADPRALWPHVHRLVAGLRPKFLFGENVARVATNGELRRVARSLAAIGYVGAWTCIRASDVGAPHRRDRLFLFAADAEHAQQQWGGQPGEAPGGRRVRPADGGEDARLFSTPCARDGREGGNFTMQPKRKVTFEAKRLELAEQGWGDYEPAIRRWERVTGRAAPWCWENRLSAPFVEWMMGLPAGWVTDVPGLSHKDRLSLLGDGVVPQQAIAAFGELWARMFHVEHAATWCPASSPGATCPGHVTLAG